MDVHVLVHGEGDAAVEDAGVEAVRLLHHGPLAPVLLAAVSQDVPGGSLHGSSSLSLSSSLT